MTRSPRAVLTLTAALLLLASLVVPAHAADWPTYGGDNQRSGVGRGVTAVHSALKSVWSVHLDGAVYGSPIVARGATIVATENDTLYRIQGNKIVWARHYGNAVPGNALPCGDINPSGITGTPAYDAATNTVVAVMNVTGPIHHVAIGIDPASGAKKWSRPVDVPAGPSGIEPAAMQQRGGLLVSGRRVYVAYGGLAGDCGPHRGAVVGVDLDHPSTSLWNFVVPATRVGGIWAVGGPTENPGGGLLVTVANGPTFESGPYDYTNAVLKLSGERIVDSYSPSTWRTDNRDDIGLGSQSPTVIGNHVFIAGKTGTAYVLNRSRLGGIGGEVSQMNLCKSFGGTAVYGDLVFVPCTDGVRAVRISATGQMTVAWHTTSSITGSPVLGGGRLWTLNPSSGRLYSLNPATGAPLAVAPTGPVNRFATPTLSGNAVIVGTLGGVVAFNWT